MSLLAPHLLLRTDTGASHAATLLRTAGYLVSKVDDDGTIEQIAGAPHVDGVVVELPAHAAIAIGRRIQERYRGSIAIVVITAAIETVKRALPSARVVRPNDADDDLVSMVDLTLVAHQLRRTG